MNMVKKVPFFKPHIGDEEIEAVSRCLKSGWLTTGPITTEFENTFSQLMGDNAFAVAVNSATAALHLGLEALGVGPGDEVIVPTLTFTATAEVVRYLGAVPVFVDIDPSTLCIDIDKIEIAISARTRAIIPVHFAGLACDLQKIRALADAHKIWVLDDAAHALPTSINGNTVGAQKAGAHVSAFSFYANKTMTTGEGGMIVTSDPEIAQRCRVMRTHGISRDVFDRFTNIHASWEYDVIAPGYKYNLTDIAAAMGIAQIDKLDLLQKKRRALALRYMQRLSHLAVEMPPNPQEGDIHSWHLFVLRLKDNASISRDELIAELAQNDIGTSVHYKPLHLMSYWSDYCQNESFPEAEKYFNSCVSLPLYPSMTHEEQDYVIKNIEKALGA
jgi:dTDP-4-amino-4,6-dideoxygalactose transaminase